MSLQPARRPRSLVGHLAPLTLLAGVLVLGACGPEEALVTAVLSESGSLAPYGKSIRRGMEVGAAQVNASGGLLGGTEPLRLSFVDDGSVAAAATEAVREALQGDSLAVLGPIGNEAFLAARQVTEEVSGAVLSPYASANSAGVGSSSLFRTYPSAQLEMGRLVALLRKQVFVKDAVIFSSRSTTGRSFKGAFGDTFQRLRGTVQATIAFPEGLTDADAAELVEDLRTKPGDAAVLLCDGADAVKLIKALHAIDYVGEVFTTSAFHHRTFHEAVGEAGQDVMYVALAWDPAAPAAQAFVTAYQAAHGEAPDVWAALGHEAVTTLAAAIDDSEGLFKNDLPPTLRSSGFRAEGVLGPTEFDDSGDVVVRSLEIFALHDGQVLPWEAYRPTWEARTQRAGAGQ